MFCTNCGAQAHDGDMFCPGCGTRLKHSAAAGASSAAYTAPDAPNPFAQTAAEAVVSKKKPNKGARVILALMFAVILGILAFLGIRGYFDSLLSGEACAACSAEDMTPIFMDTTSDSDAQSDFVLSDGDAATTSVTTTTTTTTTEKPTTTTTVDTKKQEAEEIRQLLVSKKWATELEGYKATLEFEKNGSATITVKVFFVSQSIDAKYSVSDKCHAVIMGEYSGNTYGISGYITKVSDTKLVVERDKNMGQITLTAVK